MTINEFPTYEPIGWTNKPALGLSIGCYWSYADNRMHWFDEHNLEAVVTRLVDSHPLMVSFNGIGFDFPLMRGILRRRVDVLSMADDSSRHALGRLCDDFKKLAGNSYDILAEIWKSDPKTKFKKGLNSLDAISQANELGSKLSHGAQAPHDWAAGRHADVINYCQDDVIKTRELFERIRNSGGWLMRGDGEEVGIRWINPDGLWMREVGGLIV